MKIDAREKVVREYKKKREEREEREEGKGGNEKCK